MRRNFLIKLLALMNFFSVLCFKFDGENNLELSKFHLCANFVKIFMIPAFTIFLRTNKNVRDKIIKGSFEKNKKTSDFSIKFIEVAIVYFILMTFITAIIHVVRRHEILKFLNKIISLKLSENLSQKCFKKCLIIFNAIAFMNFGILTFTVILFTNFKSLLSIIAIITSIYPQLVFYAILIFIKFIEEFIAANFEDLNNKFEEFFNLNGLRCDHTKFQELVYNFNLLSDIFDEFNSTFGAQLTIIALNIIALIFVYVSDKFINLKHLKNLFYSSSVVCTL